MSKPKTTTETDEKRIDELFKPMKEFIGMNLSVNESSEINNIDARSLERDIHLVRSIEDTHAKALERARDLKYRLDMMEKELSKVAGSCLRNSAERTILEDKTRQEFKNINEAINLLDATNAKPKDATKTNDGHNELSNRIAALEKRADTVKKDLNGNILPDVSKRIGALETRAVDNDDRAYGNEKRLLNIEKQLPSNFLQKWQQIYFEFERIGFSKKQKKERRDKNLLYLAYSLAATAGAVFFMWLGSSIK